MQENLAMTYLIQCKFLSDITRFIQCILKKSFAPIYQCKCKCNEVCRANHSVVLVYLAMPKNACTYVVYSHLLIVIKCTNNMK